MSEILKDQIPNHNSRQNKYKTLYLQTLTKHPGFEQNFRIKMLTHDPCHNPKICIIEKPLKMPLAYFFHLSSRGKMTTLGWIFTIPKITCSITCDQ